MPPMALASQMGAGGAPKAVPKAAHSRRAREMPPKAAVSQVFIYEYIGGVSASHPLESMYAILHIERSW